MCGYGLPHVSWLWTSSSCWDGLWHYHVSLSSRHHLPVGVSSDAAMCPSAPDLTSPQKRAPTLPHASWLWTLPPWGESSGAVMFPMTLNGSWATRIKKGLAALGLQLGSRDPKARSCITETPAWRADIRCHHSLQDVWAGHYITAKQCNTARLTSHRRSYTRYWGASKTCRQATSSWPARHVGRPL
jgi:hypothetical protein